MPRKDIILNLPGFVIKKVSGNNPLFIEVTYRRLDHCVYCDNKKIRKKSSFIRRIPHESIELRQTYLCLKAYKFYCSHCKKYFNQRFPGIVKYQRATESLRRQVFHQNPGQA